MNIEINEQEALTIVRALGTKYHRLKQNARWHEEKRMETLRANLKIYPESKEQIETAIAHQQRIIEHKRVLMETCDKLCRKFKEAYGIDGKVSDSDV